MNIDQREREQGIWNGNDTEHIPCWIMNFGGLKMEQNANQNNNQQPCFRKVIGNTTYVVRVHFSETSSETLVKKIKRLIGEEAKDTVWHNGAN